MRMKRMTQEQQMRQLEIESKRSWLAHKIKVAELNAERGYVATVIVLLAKKELEDFNVVNPKLEG